MGRPANMTPLPPHPAVRDGLELRRKYGHSSACALVTCPHCKRSRWYSAGVLRQIITRENFTGACRPCWGRLAKRTFRSSRNPEGRRVTTNGYVVLTRNAIPKDGEAIFDGLRGSASFVLEHRWVMSRALGRALRPDECVDHMSGIRHDNRLENLRLYVRGLNQPGSCPGAGTFYHEWQMAEARVRELEAQLTHR